MSDGASFKGQQRAKKRRQDMVSTDRVARTEGESLGNQVTAEPLWIRMPLRELFDTTRFLVDLRAWR
jgi:hypothetical protein